MRLNPSIVIVSGSSNDLGSDDTMIAGETAATIRALHAAVPRAEIFAVSPVWNDKAVPPQLDSIDLDVVRAGLRRRRLHPRYRPAALRAAEDDAV